MYNNYIFDLYGTLVDIHTDEEKAEFWKKLELYFNFHGTSYTSEALKEAYTKEVKRAVKRNKITKYPDICIDKVIKRLYVLEGVKPTAALVLETTRLFRVLSIEYVELYEGVIETLKYLKEKGKKLYILSNGQRTFSMPELIMLGLDTLFDGIYFSADIGVCKPDKLFYQHLLVNEGISVTDSIMIGNDHTTDIEGARNMNMDSIYIHSNLSHDINTVEATYSIWDGNFTKIQDI
jgi:putative hydrolase of the HAD superfamily